MSIYCKMDPQFDLVGTAETTVGVVDLAAREAPDVVVIDNSLRPDTKIAGDLASRIEALRRARPTRCSSCHRRQLGPARRGTGWRRPVHREDFRGRVIRQDL